MTVFVLGSTIANEGPLIAAGDDELRAGEPHVGRTGRDCH